MPKKQNEIILPDLDNDPELKNNLSQISSLIIEIVNYSTNILNKYMKQKQQDENETIFILFGHSLEILYSIGINIEKSCINPCKILIRALFEAMISLKYIYIADKDRKTSTYFYMFLRNKIKWLRNALEGTQENARLQKAVQNDEVIKSIPSFNQDDILADISKIENILFLPIFSDINNEYENLRTRKERPIRNPNWYNFFDGPRNIEALANTVGDSANYQIVYRALSTSVHSSDIINNYLNKNEFLPLLNTKDLRTMFDLAISYSSTITELIIQNNFSEDLENFQLWYLNEITLKKSGLKFE